MYQPRGTAASASAFLAPCVVAVLACGTPRSPSTPAETLTAAVRAGLEEPYAPSALHPFGRPNPEAPAEIEQYAFMIGGFSCHLEDKEFRDGAWIPLRKGEATWRARYVMNGHAILDEFRDEWGSTNVNVRTFSEEDGHWNVHWTAVSPTTGAVFQAREIDGAMVMESERETGEGFAYTQRFSFHDTTADRYSWTNEVVYGEGSAVTIGTIDCVRERKD